MMTGWLCVLNMQLITGCSIDRGGCGWKDVGMVVSGKSTVL